MMHVLKVWLGRKHPLLIVLHTTDIIEPALETAHVSNIMCETIRVPHQCTRTSTQRSIPAESYGLLGRKVGLGVPFISVVCAKLASIYCDKEIYNLM